jgi:hypothetical protein
MKQPTLTINPSKSITLERISDLLCSAIEGGSNYWYQIDKFNKPKSMSFRTDKNTIFRHLDYPLNEGGSLTITDMLENKGGYILNINSLQKGLQIMAEKYDHHWMNFLNGNDDAETGDVFLQCCLFGEAVYG